MTRIRHYSFVSSLHQRFRDIALPRPIPNPPEYVEPSRDSLLLSLVSRIPRLRQGLSIYVDTWKSTREDKSSQGIDIDHSHKITTESNAVEENKVGAMSSVVQYEYGLRVKALQIALKEFVKGFQEGSTRH